MRSSTSRTSCAGAAVPDPTSDIGELFIGASLEVRRPVFYATAAVAVAFLPILMMSGLQGAFFRPLSIAFLLAVGLSLLVAMSATPAHVRAGDGAAQPRSPKRAFLRRLQARPAAHASCGCTQRPRVLIAIVVGNGHRRHGVPAVAGRAPAAGFPRELSDRACIAAPGHLADRDRPRRRADLQGAHAPFPASRASPSRSAAPRTARIRMRRTRASSRCRSIRARAAARPRSTPRSAMCSTTIPNQLVEIYSVLAERIGETLSGESAPFSISVIGSDLDADDRVGAQIVEVLQQSARQRQRAPDGAAARGGAARGAAARPAGDLRLAGRGCAADGQRGLSRHRGGASSTRRTAACRWSVRIAGAGADPRPSARCCCAAATAR